MSGWCFTFVLVFPPEEFDGEYFVLPYFWIPSENLQKRVKHHNVPYDKWEREGFLNTTEGNIIYYDFIEKQIEELSQKFNIKEVMYDRWGAGQMAQNLSGQDFEMIDFAQGYKSMSQPSKELFRMVLDGRLRHGGNPVLRWMFENVHIETDAADNIKPSKKKSRDKIDGAVATIMALDGATRPKKKNTGGIVMYDPDTDTVTRNGEVIDTPEVPQESAEERRRRIERETLFGDW